jgi:hypothetical protein
MDKFLRELPSQYEVLGSFKNEYGEQFVVMKHIDVPWVPSSIYFIAGDETDWEIYEYNFKSHLMYQSFLLNNKEDEEIQKIISSLKN